MFSLFSGVMPEDLAQLVGVSVVSAGVHDTPTPGFIINQSVGLKKIPETAYCVVKQTSESGLYWFKRLHYTYTPSLS
jgi:hypothetical protein